ncbi:hypothetical protein N7539_008765 [Penicillium diatomitis]|uniref:Uncharacterized protein n=1 Tax=Penicillium diatomitis TaxID=2819901 RepID=A0A9W9WQH5_9EURO|nr:uncharacterized protein N7539_008765 [Penicillium diatomitis]KAJ5471822.1 hypothetical protein N7539_008765 [Penicillium diatomitis]
MPDCRKYRGIRVSRKGREAHPTLLPPLHPLPRSLREDPSHHERVENTQRLHQGGDDDSCIFSLDGVDYPKHRDAEFRFSVKFVDGVGVIGERESVRLVQRQELIKYVVQ